MASSVLTSDRGVAEAPWPAEGPAGAVVLVVASTPVEKQVIEEWLARARPGGRDGVEVIAAGDPQLAAALARGEERNVVPVRVAWLPRERQGTRAARIRDVLAGGNPRRPSPRMQERIRRHEPDRCRVIVGAPASVGELSQRFDDTAAGGEFVDFVGRQATLAIERAERALVGTQYKVPRLVYEEIVDSTRFREGAARLAGELDRPAAEVAAEAATCLEEMAASQSRLAIDLWAQFGRFLSRAYSVDVDAAQLEELRALGRRHALVFLPSHKSYLDPLVLQPSLVAHGFPPNHILGGINISFWPMGPWLRRTGMVFIRRSFRDNEVYKWVLREYLGYLVRKRFNLEWYIEGGRSRTGKLRPPRYGILNYVVSAFEDADVDDVLIVPVSIAYDQLQEVGAMAAEARGGSKQSEGVGWLIGYARSQGRGLGQVHVRFGEPLSMRDALAAEDDGRLAVPKVAFEVCHRINQATPITTTALVTMALLGVEDRALTMREVGAIIDPLLEYVRRRGLPTTGDMPPGSIEPVRQALDALGSSGVVTRFDGGTEPVYSIGADQHLVAAFYRNTAIHFFVNRAIAELLAARVMDERPDDPVAWAGDEAMRLRDLLKFEFFFAERREFLRELRAEMAIFDPEWEQRAGEPEEMWARLTGSRLFLAHRVLRSFLEAYQVVADRLAARDPSAAVEQKPFLAECRGLARQYRMQQRIWSTESISDELFATALKLAGNRELVDPGADDLAERRHAFAAEVADVVRRIGRVRDLALADLQDGNGTAAA